MDTDFYRMKRLPPYVIAEVNAMRHAARRAGKDIIDLGMGNPDLPPPQHVIDKLCEVAAKPDAHGYSQSKGIPGLRRAQANYYGSIDFGGTWPNERVTQHEINHWFGTGTYWNWANQFSSGVWTGARVNTLIRQFDGDTAVIRAAGQVVETVSLTQARTFSVSGPLGATQIEIEPGRARVARDPSPRQLCVRQGWLTQSGQAALCLPNQVSLEIRGRLSAYDTLGY